MTDAQDGRGRAAVPGDDDPPLRAAPRPLTPSRPWEGEAESSGTDRSRDTARRPRHSVRAAGSGSSPSRSWARGPEQIESPALDEPDVRGVAAPGLAPLRPWMGERPAGSLPSQGPRPSNPDVVLRGLAAELGADRPVESDEERRRRFARQHAAADAARLAAVPPPVGAAEVAPVGTKPVVKPVEPQPGALGKAARWLLQRSPGPAAAGAVPVAVDVADAPAGPRRGWRRRRGTRDDEEGPFFPPETTTPADPPVSGPRPRPVPRLDVPTVASILDDVPLPAASEVPAVPVSPNRPRPRPRPPVTSEAQPPPSADTLPPEPEQPSPARHRPRPRPAAARAAASPAAETSTEPDQAGHRPLDINRFLAATEPQPGDDDPEPKEPMRRRRRIRGSRGLRLVTRITIVVAVAVAAAIVLRIYVVAPYYIPSGSMEKTLHGGSGTNDRILVDKITYRIHDPHQGDIVVFDRPDTWKVPDKTLVKRIIGLPGDRVQLRDGLVYVNGLRLTENYLDKDCPAPVTRPLNGTTRWTVPMDDYFVMGDNRCDSDDSRMYGPVPRSKIVGRAFLIIWPLSRFGAP